MNHREGLEQLEKERDAAADKASELFYELHRAIPRAEAAEAKLAEVENFRIEDIGKYRELMAELRDVRAKLAEAQAEIERLREVMEDAARCATLHGYAGDSWGAMAMAAAQRLLAALNQTKRSS